MKLKNPIREIRKAKTPPCTQCVHSRFKAFNSVTILCKCGAYLDHVERTCCECRWFKPTDGDDGVCGLELEAAIANEELAGKSMADAANKAVDWALDHLKDGDEIACEHFKP